MKQQTNMPGFTLAELLISLAILGVIVAFTIPKVITSQQNGQFNAVAKEAVAMVSAGYQNYQLTNIPTSSMNIGILTPYFNFIARDTVTVIDHIYGSSTLSCATYVCYRLHSGAMLLYNPGETFGGTNTTNATIFYLDPDGEVTDGTTNGPGKSATFGLYYTGKITSRGQFVAGTADGLGSISSSPDPPWLIW